MSEGKPKTFLEFIEDKPNLKFFFTGGKGGVGKTIAAAGIAYYYASQGKKTLLASLNPVHSLSSIFEQELWGGDIKKVEGVENLYAVEVDIKDTVEQYKQQLAERLRWFLKWADIPVKADDFIEIAATNPAFEESAMFDSMLDVMLKEGGNYDKIVFDCAAVANAVRLLGLSKIYELWLTRMIKSREEALSLRVKLSFRKDKVMEEIKKDPMMADLLNMRKRMQEAKKVLNNPDVTAFFFVTIPLALPIAVVKRFINMVKGFDIPIGGVFVNMVIPEDVVKGKATEYMINKYKEQQDYLSIIKRDLWPLVRAVIPLFPTEIVGIDMIAKVADAMVNWKPQS
ncbi:MAG: arsenic transporter [Thermofilum sp. ex4484_82]|nr:MAG: arsenic transporter [Thermofilum sp. ex4484_82]OYT38298.1 MAG: arsenic transporter [Archaeoglobales archaeon ex4484_92]